MSTQNNAVISEAVTKINEARTAQVVSEAVRITTCIASEQEKIEGCNSRIVILREEALKLAKNVVTEELILGTVLPDNANRETIAEVIKKANKDKQYVVEQSASRLTTAITNEQETIVLIEKRISELRTALLKLTAKVITVDQVVG